MKEKKLNISEQVKGPSWILVCLSESTADALFFNEVVDRLYGREVQTSEELEKAFDVLCELEDKGLSDKELSSFKLKSMEDLQTFHKAIIDKYWLSVV